MHTAPSTKRPPRQSPPRRIPAAPKELPLPPASPLTVSRPELLVDGSDRHYRSLVHGLFGFFARHEAVRSGFAARIGLVGIAYTVLISIRHLHAEEGDIGVSRVAEHLHLSGAFVTTVTNKLVKRGLIHKHPGIGDRRRVRLEVSEEGDALLAGLAPVQRQVADVEFGCLSAGDFLSLLEMTNRLIESSDKALRLLSFLEPAAAVKIPPAIAREQAAAAPRKARTRR